MIFILEDDDRRIEHFGLELDDTPHHVERVVPEAKAWLEEHAGEVALYCLDNDLYVPGYEGEEGEGRDLCAWILERCPPAPIVVHTTNTHAATIMEMACAEAGWDFHRVVPYLDTRWIGERWIETVRELLPEGGGGR